jgi:cellulose synthase/poly-beta-1,6-N-acetylglucosamine synthase-like glycosyltransferase
MTTNPHLSIIIPAYKEEGRITNMLAALASLIPTLPYPVEVIVVDDGSPDNTVETIERYTSRRAMDYLRVIRLHLNRGKGFAVKTGMRAARGLYVLFADADNSTDIRRHLPSFMEAAHQGADVVIASIEVPGAQAQQENGAHRSFLHHVSRALINFFAAPGISDTQRGFKLFSRRAVHAIVPHQTLDRFGFDFEILAIALRRQLRILELPVVWKNPSGSTVRLRDYFRTFADLLKVAVNKARGLYGGSSEEEYLMHFDSFDQQKKGKGFTYKGKEFVHHTDLHHSATALYTLTYSQKILMSFMTAVVLFALVVNWHFSLLVIFSGLTFLYFGDLLFNAFLIYRGVAVAPEVIVPREAVESLDESTLPTYTIFCPLYKEWQVVDQFVAAMRELDYPPEKLQIMLLLEENDEETIRYVQNANLPGHVETVIVPHSNPKTKPKAMNYGMQHVRGEYLVIFDAEDRPESDQLKKAVRAFETLSEKTVCVQAKLNFYNPRQNLLTKLFTAEYSLWFDLVLPGLQSIRAPLPLGGTSNHFKVSALRELCGWDAFNVTEDCDLGIRLAKLGYRTAVMESTTHEEANSHVGNWYSQRSRWIKGYLQTYFVHMRHTREFLQSNGIRDYLAFQAIVGGKILSMFVNPIMWLTTIVYFLFRAQTSTFIESLFPGPVLYIGVFSLLVGNFMYLYYYMVACAKRGQYDLIKYAFLVPFYWLLMSAAAWRAFYEIIVKPHYWAKTVHGLHLGHGLSAAAPLQPAQS